MATQMKTTSRAPTSPDPSLPNARKHPLLALKYVLFGYLPLGGPAALGIPLNFIPLEHLARYADYFITEGYLSTLMCFLIPLFLPMMDRQLARKKAAYGGWQHPNPCSPADLLQQPADREVLRLLGSDALFQSLKDELRLLFRLLREAQLAYRRDPLAQPAWLPLHQAAMVVLLRVAQISAALRRKGSHWLRSVCVIRRRSSGTSSFTGHAPPRSSATGCKPAKTCRRVARSTSRFISGRSRRQAVPSPPRLRSASPSGPNK